eukprot:2465565-Pyramimonas_sp.AAC.1
MANPCILRETGTQTARLGLFAAFDPMDFESPPDPTRRKLPLDEHTQAPQILTYIHARSRATHL